MFCFSFFLKIFLNQLSFGEFSLYLSVFYDDLSSFFNMYVGEGWSTGPPTIFSLILFLVCLSVVTHVSQRLSHTILIINIFLFNGYHKDRRTRSGVLGCRSESFTEFSEFVVERRRKVDGHFRPEVESQEADRVDHPSDMSPLPPNPPKKKKDEKWLSISLKITNLIDISSSLNMLVLSQMTHRIEILEK